MYLEDKKDEWFKMYPSSFTSQGNKLLKILGNNENKIDYKNLFPDSTFYIISFLKKCGTLSSLLEGPVTRKMTVDSANFDQISFIIKLMHGYNEGELYGIKELASKFFRNTILRKANEVFLDAKKNPRKGIKRFFPKNFNKFISKKQTIFLLNAMQLYNYRNKIIELLENKNIKPSMHAYNARS